MFEVNSPTTGTIVIADAELVPHGDGDVSQSELRELARQGDLFFIESEEPIKYRIELVASGDIPGTIAGEVEPRGGTFRLRLPSGHVQIGPVPFSCIGQISVPPGDYLLSPFVQRVFDAGLFRERMKQIVGESDWRFHKRIENFGCAGCLSPVIGGVIVLCAQFTREYRWAAWVVLAIFGIPTLLSYLLTKLPRYKRVQQVYDSCSKEIPDFVIVLKLSTAAGELPGGWVQGI